MISCDVEITYFYFQHIFVSVPPPYDFILIIKYYCVFNLTEERTKLFEEVEKEWTEREKRVSLSENDNEADDEEDDNELEEDEDEDGCGGGSCSDEADSDELDECIVKVRYLIIHFKINF